MLESSAIVVTLAWITTMFESAELSVVYEDGVLKPDQRLDLPEHTRLQVLIHRVETTPERAAAARRRMREIAAGGMFRLNGHRLTRDDMHERG